LPEHGGRLLAAAAHYGIPADDWVDLSTGISPWAREPDPPPTAVWQRLPEEGDGLADVAAAYYGTNAVLATPGSQAALQTLPRLRPAGAVAVTAGSYFEHQAAWEAAGHRVLSVGDSALADAADSCDAVVVVNPDNPTGRRLDPAILHELRRRLARRGGWLVVDEAFMDSTPSDSLVTEAGAEGLVVLRSLGKFFGLAGVRLGFAALPAGLRQTLAERLGPWAVANPARWAGRCALADGDWQHNQRGRLNGAAERLDALLESHGLEVTGGTALFRYCECPEANEIAEALAGFGVLVRTFDTPPALRLGLPATEAAWQQLDKALQGAG
jgi:cobalamin biosynthetic protein CobC